MKYFPRYHRLKCCLRGIKNSCAALKKNLISTICHWKNGTKKLLVIQIWTFFSSTAWLPKGPILGRNRNLKGSLCHIFIFSLVLPLWNVFPDIVDSNKSSRAALNKKPNFSTLSLKKRNKKVANNSELDFFSSTACLPKRPILGRNRNLKGSPCRLFIFSLGLPLWNVFSDIVDSNAV